MWNLRLPVGLFFLGIGIVLCAIGLGMPDTRAPLTRVNVNLYSGVAMIAFGAVMVWLSRRR